MNIITKTLNDTKNLLKGMGVTLKYFFKPTVTLIYPKNRPNITRGSRGVLKTNYDEKGRLKCTACQICTKVCPVNAIEIKISPQEKPPKAEKYIFYHEKCIYCGLCTENCPFDAISWGEDFEMADIKRNKKIVYKEFKKL